jgi:argininosuccinate lyase
MLLATDLADQLVKNGVPFRQAHELVGKAVAVAIAEKIPLNKFDLGKISEHFGNNTAEIFQIERALASRTNPGCPNPLLVREQVARWKSVLS